MPVELKQAVADATHFDEPEMDIENDPVLPAVVWINGPLCAVNTDDEAREIVATPNPEASLLYSHPPAEVMLDDDNDAANCEKVPVDEIK